MGTTVTVTAKYNTDNVYLLNPETFKNASLNEANNFGTDSVNSSNWSGCKINNAYITVRVESYLQQNPFVLTFTLNGRSGSITVPKNTTDSSSITIDMPTSSYLLQGILEKQSLQITTTRSGSGSGTNVGRLKSNAILTIVCELPEPYEKCTTPTITSISPNSVAPGGSASLTWSASTANGSGHSVSGYHVYECATSGGTYTKITSSLVTSPYSLTGKNESENGKSYYYKVKAISNQDSSYDSELSGYKSLKTEYSAASISSFTLAGKTGTIYIGGSSASVEGKWSGSGGTNNAITKYIIKDNSDTEVYNGSNTTETIQVKKDSSYSIQAVAKYKSTDFVKTIQVKQITRTSTATISSSPVAGNIKTRSINLSWSEPVFTGKKDGTNISYKLTYTCGSNTGNLTDNTFTETSKTITLPNSIATGQEVTIKLQYTVTAADSGTRSWTQEIGKYILIGTPNAPIITDFYDTNGPASMQTGIQEKGYKNVKIIFTPASKNESAGSGEIEKYVLRYWKNQDTYKEETLTNISGTSITLNRNLETDFNQVQEGASINIQIGACDKYGTWIYSNIATMQRFKAPSFSWGTINVGKVYSDPTSKNASQVINSISGQITGTVPAISGSSNVVYKIRLKYNNYFSIADGAYTNWLTFGGPSATFLYDLSYKFPKTTGTGSFADSIYTEVVTNKNPKPVGIISLQCYYEGFSNYTWTVTKTFNYDYTKELDDLDIDIYKISYLGDRTDYANPFEDYSILFKELECYGPSGKDSGSLITDQGGTIDIIVTKNNQSLKISSNEDANYVKKVTDNYNSYSQSNLVIPYTITYILKYNNVIKDSKEIVANVQIYRWYDKDKHTLTNVELKTTEASNGSKTTTLIGDIILPATLCSNYGNNLRLYNSRKNIYYRLINLEKPDTAIKSWTQITANQQEQLNIHFEINNFSFSTLSLQAEIRYRNTNPNTNLYQIIAKTNTYINRGETATLALRKSYIGINVNKDYQASELSETPTIRINQHSGGTAEVIQLEATGGADNYITFKTGSELIGSIGKMAHSSHLFITGGVKIVDTNIPVNQTDNNTYTLTDPDITADTIQEIIPSPTISTKLLKAFQKANFIGGTQTEGSCEIICHGIKPTDSIPIQLIIRGG